LKVKYDTYIVYALCVVWFADQPVGLTDLSFVCRAGRVQVELPDVWMHDDFGDICTLVLLRRQCVAVAAVAVWCSVWYSGDCGSCNGFAVLLCVWV
jgi:hypothetical protein